MISGDEPHAAFAPCPAGAHPVSRSSTPAGATIPAQPAPRTRTAVRSLLRGAALRVPPVGRLLHQLAALGTADPDTPQVWPPGHYYSPIPSLEDVTRYERQIFSIPPSVPGVDLNGEAQLEQIERLGPATVHIPFGEESDPRYRYNLANELFSYGDGVALFGMLRLLRPRRLMEIGSGFSSALILDTNDLFLDGSMRCTFIEPHPERLFSLLRTADRTQVEIVERRLQDVDLDRFDALEAGDVLFIDSSHVSKAGSDVNRLMFEVLPRLRHGVVVHIHDIFYPFEYPREWIVQGRTWTESYLVHAFLQFNSEFRILLFNSYLAAVHRERVASILPWWGRNPGGSLWLERI
jgi:hypothetical protein